MVNVRDSPTRADERDAAYRNWDFSDDESEPDPFKDLIQRDPVVCDHCFLTKYTRVTHEWWRGSFGWLDYERWIPYPEKVEDIPADSTTGGTRLACGNCGYRSDKHRPIPKDQIVEFALNLSETLDLKEIQHDRRVLLHEVRRRNTSQNQGKQDSHVFSPAVEMSIESVD